MLNKNGFVLLETLIVTVFITGIFTFLYVSVIPLLGTYDSLTNENNIDSIYKLYHIRKAYYNDDNYNYNHVGNGNYGIVSCNNFVDPDKCNSLINILDLSNYQIVYANGLDGIVKNQILSDTSINEKIREYIDDYDDYDEAVRIIILYDITKDQIAHIGLGYRSDPYIYFNMAS